MSTCEWYFLIFSDGQKIVLVWDECSCSTHFDGWIWLLISSDPETPTSTEFNSTYSHVTERHDTQSLTYLSMQHWIQPKVFIFRVSGPLGLADIHIHALLNDACEQSWPCYPFWLPGIIFFFLQHGWILSLQEKALWGAALRLWD